MGGSEAAGRSTGPLAAALIGGAAVGLGYLVPGAPSALLVALLLGAAAANFIPVVVRPLEAGASAIGGPLLRVGIILLGAKGSLDLVAAVGPAAIAAVVVTMAAVFGYVTLAARRTRIAPALAVLLAVGTAVCGNSAIAAAAPLVRARRPEVALAIGTITLFGTAALLVFPILGRALGLDELTFGLWAGAGVHDTSQVVATAFAFSPEAGEVATIVKLGRNTLMLPILIGLALFWQEDVPRLAAARSSLVLVGGYVAMVALNSAGVLPPALRDVASVASAWCLAVAMAAVGLGLRLGEFRSLGGAAVALGFGASVVGGSVALGMALVLGS